MKLNMKEMCELVCSWFKIEYGVKYLKAYGEFPELDEVVYELYLHNVIPVNTDDEYIFMDLDYTSNEFIDDLLDYVDILYHEWLCTEEEEDV